MKVTSFIKCQEISTMFVLITISLPFSFSSFAAAVSSEPVADWVWHEVKMPLLASSWEMLRREGEREREGGR